MTRRLSSAALAIGLATLVALAGLAMLVALAGRSRPPAAPPHPAPPLLSSSSSAGRAVAARGVPPRDGGGFQRIHSAEGDGPQGRPELVRADRLRRLMRPEQAPALDRPHAVAAARAPLRPTDRVVGLTIGGRARAYPLTVLGYHRVVNDVLAGVRVAVAHSPLSGATLCLRDAPRLQHSGAVDESDDVLRELDGAGGDALWSVLLGRRVLGAARATAPAPRRAPCLATSWAHWRRLRPDTEVAWPRRSAAARALGFDYRRDPWAWYRADPEHLVAPVRYVDLRLPQKQLVLGVVGRDGALAIPIPARGRRLINDVRGEETLVVLDGDARCGAAYRRRLDGRTLTFAEIAPGVLEDDHTRSRWNDLGEAVAGPLAGRRLEVLPGGAALFFAWAALHPGTSIANQSPASGPPVSRATTRSPASGSPVPRATTRSPASGSPVPRATTRSPASGPPVPRATTRSPARWAVGAPSIHTIAAATQRRDEDD